MNLNRYFAPIAFLGFAISQGHACFDPCDPEYGQSAREITYQCDTHDHIEGDTTPVSAPITEVRRQNRRIMRHHRAPQAGGTLDNWNVEASGAYTDFEFTGGIDGDSTSLTLAGSANHGDNITGIALTYDSMDIDTVGTFDTTTIDGYYGYTVNDHLTLGALGSYSWVDTAGGDAEGQYTVGPFASASVALCDRATLGATTSIVYLDGIGSSEWVWDSLVDITTTLTDAVSVSVYAGFTDTAEASAIQGYWTAGADITWNVNDKTQVRIGYEQSIDHDFVDDRTFLLSASRSF